MVVNQKQAAAGSYIELRNGARCHATTLNEQLPPT